jgi:hypothetical protein
MGPNYAPESDPLFGAAARLALKIREHRPDVMTPEQIPPTIVIDLHALLVQVTLPIGDGKALVIEHFHIDPSDQGTFGQSVIPLLPSTEHDGRAH